MKRLIAVLLTALMLLAMAVPAFAASYEDAYSYVVRIYTQEYEDIYLAGTNECIDQNVYGYIGTGFAVGTPGQPVQYFVTNRHVVTPDDDYVIGTITVDDQEIPVEAYYSTQSYIIFSNSSEKVPVNIYAVSDRCDLAVISMNEATDKREPALIYPQDIKKLGHKTVYSVGFPGISDTYNDINSAISTLNSYESDLTITDGLISAVKEDAVTKAGETIQHMAKISGGNSGGPLVDAKGYVIGVNRSTWKEDGDYALAVSANELVRFLDDERVPYMTVQDWQRRNIIMIACIAACVIVLAVVAVLVIKKRGGGSKPVSGGSRTLVCTEGALAGKSFKITPGARFSIGYDASRSQIVFPNGTPGISGKHCSISFDGKTVMVTDEGSRYGTWIDQTRLTPGTATVMHRGQTLYFGSKKQAMKLDN
ncbi:MAG: trypsin-like peptidase domain-containing protein [Clostridia bacterium]|nr:trypsin-like peptidase domain-containing protein [Clostridia bacterium]